MRSLVTPKRTKMPQTLQFSKLRRSFFGKNVMFSDMQ